MCGRYTLTMSGSMIADHFDFVDGLLDLIPRYNVAPTQEVLTITNDDEDNHAQFMRWGLVLFWAKDVRIGSKIDHC